MKAEIESEITFTREYGLGSAAGQAHVAEEQAPQEDEEEYGDDDQCPEGVLEIDLSGMSVKQSEPILLAARQAGMRVRQPFKRAPGGDGGGGNRFQPTPKAPLHRAPVSVRPSAATVAASTARETATALC